MDATVASFRLSATCYAINANDLELRRDRTAPGVELSLLGARQGPITCSNPSASQIPVEALARSTSATEHLIMINTNDCTIYIPISCLGQDSVLPAQQSTSPTRCVFVKSFCGVCAGDALGQRLGQLVSILFYSNFLFCINIVHLLLHLKDNLGSIHLPSSPQEDRNAFAPAK